MGSTQTKEEQLAQEYTSKIKQLPPFKPPQNSQELDSHLKKLEMSGWYECQAFTSDLQAFRSLFIEIRNWKVEALLFLRDLLRLSGDSAYYNKTYGTLSAGAKKPIILKLQNTITKSQTRISSSVKTLQTIETKLGQIGLEDSLKPLSERLIEEMNKLKETDFKRVQGSDVAQSVLGGLVVMFGVVLLEIPFVGAPLITTGYAIQVDALRGSSQHKPLIDQLENCNEHLKTQTKRLMKLVGNLRIIALNIQEVLGFVGDTIKHLENDLKDQTIDQDWGLFNERTSKCLDPVCSSFVKYLENEVKPTLEY